MNRTIRISHVIWGYAGGGVDSVLDSYLMADEAVPSEIVSNVIIVRPSSTHSKKTLKSDVNCEIVPYGTKNLIKVARITSKAILRNNADVVFLNGFNSTILGFLLRRLLPSQLPIISTYHGSYFARSATDWLKAQLFNKLERHFFKHHAALVIAVSYHSKSLLERSGIPSEKIVVLHNAISKEALPIKKFKHSNSTGVGEKLQIITVSRLAPQKGIHVLIDAFSNLAKTFPSLDLVIVGGGPLEMELKKQANNTGLPNRIHFLGPRTDIASLLSNADIFAMTSRQEDHSISILEAMRAGLPLVVTDVGGNAESIRNNKEGFLVSDLDVIKTEECISALVTCPKLRTKFGQSARARWESKFETNTMILNLKNIIIENVLLSKKTTNG